MAINSQHPEYSKFKPDWDIMRDTYDGERVVKNAGTQYLPATGGMILDGLSSGQAGYAAYESYLTRAVFPDYVRDGVESLIGMMFQKPPVITLPAALEPLRENATVSGESLEILLRRINAEQLTSGRIGILLDLPLSPDQTNPLPYIAPYNAETILNWDDGSTNEQLNLVVLDESNYRRNTDFQWEFVNRYRLLQFGELPQNEMGASIYRQGLFDLSNYSPDDMFAPTIRGNTLSKIPFVFINSKDITTNPDQPPLLGLANLCLTIYRGEADYRQCLFLQGQDTLVVVGGARNNGEPGEEDAIRTGAGSRIEVDIGGDAKYIGVNSNGLSEQRQALENDRARAELKAGKLINEKGSAKTSGEALKTRFSAQTATLNQIALAGAAGLEEILRMAAEWVGANPDEVKVVPNLEFADFGFNAQEMVYLMTARKLGAPLSLESIHSIMVDRGMTTSQFKDELAAYEKEIEKEASDAMEKQKQISAMKQPEVPVKPQDQKQDDSQN